MNAVIAIVVIVALGILGFVLIGNPFAPTEIMLPNEEYREPVAGTEFGTGDFHQVRPTDVRVRIHNSHLDIPPAEWAIEIYNGKSFPVTFGLSYRVPGEPWLGYERAPVEAEGWLEFPKTITVEPYSVGHARVVLKIPAGAVPKGTDWCFLIFVGEVTSGSLVTEQGVWWLVEMR